MSNVCNLLKRVISKWYEFGKTVTFLIGLVVPLVVSQIILAQATEDCYVPPGTTPIEDPTVTADQAAADESLVKDFTLEVSATFKDFSSNVN